MKKIFLVLLVLLMVGCQQNIEGMIYLDDVSALTEADNVQNILKQLPGNLHMKDFKEDPKRIVVNYEVPLSKDMTTPSEYWEADDAYQSLLLYNGGILFSQYPDLENVQFFLLTETKQYYVTLHRDAFEEIVVKQALDDVDIQMLSDVISEPERVDEYFASHSVLIFERDEDC